MTCPRLREAWRGGWGALALLVAGAGPAAAQGYTVTDLGTMGGISIYASAINNRGQVVGWASFSTDGSTTRAFLWQDGVMQDLGSLGGSQAYAQGIDDTGRIVGSSSLAGSTFQHALLWENGVMRDLGTL